MRGSLLIVLVFGCSDTTAPGVQDAATDTADLGASLDATVDLSGDSPMRIDGPAMEPEPDSGLPDAIVPDAAPDAVPDAPPDAPPAEPVDPCAGVVCDEPPGPCYQPNGTCVDGTCTYAPADGLPCDDGDPCTLGDICGGGACTGAMEFEQSIATPQEGVLYALTADGGGTAHLFYVEVGSLVHASREPGGTWASTAVPTPEPATRHMIGAATAPAGTLHLAYHDAAGLAYAALDGVWTFEVIEFEPSPAQHASSVGLFPTVAVDANGIVHVAYGRYVNGRLALVVARRAIDGIWSREVVDEDWVTGVEPAIAVSQTGSVHVAYWSSTYEALVHAERLPAGVWSIEQVAHAAGVAHGPTLALDSSGNPHVGFETHAWDGRHLRYAYRDAGVWSFESVDEGDAHAASIAVDADGSVWLAYLRERGHAVRAARRAPDGRWRKRTLVPAVPPGFPQSLAGETALTLVPGAALVVYDWAESPSIAGVEFRGVLLASGCDGACGGVTCSGTPATCQAPRDCADGICEAVEAEGAVCQDGDDCTADSCQGGVCTGRRLWQREIADAEGGWYPSAAVDTLGGLHVASQDRLRSRLRYAYLPSGGTWAAETVEIQATGPCGKSGTGFGPSLAVGTDGSVHIGYVHKLFDCVTPAQTLEIRYAHRDGGGSPWVIDLVDIGLSGHETALALEGSTVHLVYGGGDGGVYHADNGTGVFVTEIVDPFGGNEYHSSALAVDAAGTLHAAYLAYTDVRHAVRPSGGSWSITTVDTEQSGPQWMRRVSLDLDESDEPHIAHVQGCSVAESHDEGAGWVTTTLFGVCHSQNPAIRMVAGTHTMAFLVHATDGPRLAYAVQPPGQSWIVEQTREPWTGEVGVAHVVDASGGVHLFHGLEGLVHYWFTGCP